ncbi:MAG: response regulator [Pseudomonadota bacterium]
MSALSAFLLKNLKDNMSEEFRERGILLSREFSQKIAEGIVIEDKSTLDKFISQLCGYKDVLYVYIYSETGLMLSEKVIVEGLESKLPSKSKLDYIEIEEIQVGGTRQHAILEINAPVNYDKERVGHIRLGISLERIREEVNKRILNSSLLVVIFIAIGLIICFFFSRSFSMPIRQLLEGVKNIGHGSLSQHVIVQNKYEIGELAFAFNQMIDRLSESDDKLKRYAQELEIKVVERTFELKKSNAQLEQDIVQRRKIEKALRESKEQYQMLFNHLPAGVIHFNENGIILDLNNRFAEIMGTPPDKLFGFDMLQLPGNEKLSIAMQYSIDGELGYFEGDYVSAFSGENLFLKVIYHGITDEAGTFIAGVGLFEDMTLNKRSEAEKIQLQAKLQRSQKMEVIGILAGGVAHDLNNILSGLVTYPELLLMNLSEDHPLRKCVLTIQDSGIKAATIVQDLLTLARRGVAVSEVVNMNDIVSDFLRSPVYDKILQYHPGIQLEMKIEQTLPNMSGSPVHLSKCVMNLISNAAEAMTDGGKIVISTKHQYIDKPIQGYDEIRRGEYIVLSITDFGVGMSSEEVSRIFEPFYTKKIMGRSGTGLGMAVVWGAVKDHNGYIDVQSIKGQGSRFDLYFPATREKLTVREAGVLFDDKKGSEKILIVDDVEQQREIASLILEKLGYSVETVSTGEEAVEYMKNNSADLLILDMIMEPGIDGLETYKRILEYHPHQKAIIASGFSESNRVKEAQRMGVGAYIKKPYSLEKIVAAVRAELDA